MCKSQCLGTRLLQTSHCKCSRNYPLCNTSHCGRCSDNDELLKCLINFVHFWYFRKGSSSQLLHSSTISNTFSFGQQKLSPDFVLNSWAFAVLRRQGEPSTLTTCRDKARVFFLIHPALALIRTASLLRPHSTRKILQGNTDSIFLFAVPSIPTRPNSWQNAPELTAVT